MPIQAYLVRPGLIAPERSSAGDLADALLDRDRMGGTGPAFPRFRDLLSHAEVLERRTVARWDVWIVRSNQESGVRSQESEDLLLTPDS